MARTRNRPLRELRDDARVEVDPARLALLRHAKRRSPVRLADGRRAHLVFASPYGRTCRVQLGGGGHLTVPVTTITIIDDQAAAA